MRMTRNTFMRKRDSITAYTDFKNQAFTYTFTSIAFPPFTTAPTFVSSSRNPFFSSTPAPGPMPGSPGTPRRLCAPAPAPGKQSRRSAEPLLCRYPGTRTASGSYSQSTRRHGSYRQSFPRKYCRQPVRPRRWPARHPPCRHSQSPYPTTSQHPPRYRDTAVGPTGMSCQRHCVNGIAQRHQRRFISGGPGMKVNRHQCSDLEIGILYILKTGIFNASLFLFLS